MFAAASTAVRNTRGTRPRAVSRFGTQPTRGFVLPMASGVHGGGGAGPTKRILAAFGLLALELGKVSFAASYRQIAELAGVSVGTVAKHQQHFARWVYPVAKGSRFQGTSTTWRLNLARVKGNMPEAYLSGKEGLFPTARPADNYWHRWSSGWAVWCELSTTNESATASAIGSAIGLHPATVRRALRRLEADGLVSRSEGLWSRNTSLASEPIAGEGLVDHAAERRLRHEQDRERRRRWVSHLHDAHDVIDLATERIKREAAGEATGDAFASGVV